VDTEEVVDPFFQLAWNDVRKADSSGPSIPSGTYVWWDDGTTTTLHYYDMGYKDYVDYITANPNDPGTTIDPSSGFFPAEVALDLGNKSLTVKGDVYVSPTGTNNELNVVARLGAEEAPPGDPESTGAGAGGGATFSEQVTDITTNVMPGISSTYSTSPTYHVTWDRVPLLGPVPGGGQKYVSPTGFGSYIWGGYISLTDNGDGTGTLVLDDKAGLNLSPRLDLNPVGSLNQAFAYANAHSDPAILQIAATIGQVGGGGPVVGMPDNGKIPIGVADTLSAADLKFGFDPPPGTPATLTCEGNVHLTSAITGQDGSITSGGDIKITGLGAEFSANEQSGVNMYAVGDIVFSTLDNDGAGNYSYRDVNLKGVIYAQGDFVCRLGSSALTSGWGNLNLEGCLIAYGGDPSGEPGSNGKGLMDIRAEKINIAFDSVYLGSLTVHLPANFVLEPMSWSNSP